MVRVALGRPCDKATSAGRQQRKSVKCKSRRNSLREQEVAENQLMCARQTPRHEERRRTSTRLASPFSVEQEGLARMRVQASAGTRARSRALSDPWCVVQTASAAVAARRRSTAVPSAEPSVGSVPAPTSSSSTRELRLKLEGKRGTRSDDAAEESTVEGSPVSNERRRSRSEAIAERCGGRPARKGQERERGSTFGWGDEETEARREKGRQLRRDGETASSSKRRSDLLQDSLYARDVRREGRERLHDGLVVADVGHHLVEVGHPDGRRRRRRVAASASAAHDPQPRASHQRSQAKRLERHRLAARVGAGDDCHALAYVHDIVLGAQRAVRCDERLWVAPHIGTLLATAAQPVSLRRACLLQTE
eukprot:6201341-Pleurochrysis_carterae.AAC.2